MKTNGKSSAFDVRSRVRVIQMMAVSSIYDRKATMIRYSSCTFFLTFLTFATVY